ncbi:hypothetical protein [Aquitalea pelogenes]|uniref:hypothetical protein n=1 Tax=Aquitalea pelogenes TaxID=1293573 RepID=UPI0007870533|nr:hypothetical protein [Aquitalea pelogenes]
MKKIRINFKNCYGITNLEHEFSFGEGLSGDKTIAVYAPNGLMKTSFTKTFEKLSKSEQPEEERYKRKSTYDVYIDDLPIKPESIYVLKSEIDIQEDSAGLTDILVNPQHKKRYDELLIDIEKQKSKLLSLIQKNTGIQKKDVERTILNDVKINTFQNCIEFLLDHELSNNVKDLTYSILFDAKAADVLKTPEFISSANDFNKCYQELFTKSGTIYKKRYFQSCKGGCCI